jgi:two-component system cell cycle sensor histidine kinase/response regulator CckA
MATTLSNKSGSLSHESQDIRALLLTQKNELIGELAQAMANQFNNIMMAVTSYAELELKRASRKDRHGLEQVITHATRATVLIQKLLSFSRKHTPSPEPLELDEVITDLSSLLREVLGEQSDLAVKLDAASEMISADRVEFEQTLLTLVVIARNTMEGSGQLAISTAIADIKDDFIGENDRAGAGRYVVVAVEIHAPASPVQSSTLDQSQRVNLSLAAVRGILKDCHGLARFSNEPGTSSSFKLYLPVFVREAIEEQGANIRRNPAVARTILVVEDDDAVRIPAAEFLMMEGFKVLQARTGTEALNLVQQSRSSLDILVTDIFMPKMNGHEVAASLLEQHPELKVLYISGDTERNVRPAAEKASNTMLRKPFRLNMLRDKIHDLLGE